jgi:hypothetical protein
MGRDKDQGKRKEIQSDENASSEDHDRALDDDYSQLACSKWPMPQDPPARALGRGRGCGDSGSPMVRKKVLTSGPKGSRARMNNASTDDEGGHFDDDIDISIYTKMIPLFIHRNGHSKTPSWLTTPSMPMTSPLSGSEIHRSSLITSFVMIVFGVFIKPIGMNLSSSPTKTITTDMKWIDWQLLHDLTPPSWRNCSRRVPSLSCARYISSYEFLLQLV